ncbi:MULTISPECIES: PAS domain-containing sensor histidine kinase [unclassified Rhizobium]|uniref:PAS domain-containing sensor histidine kinase n=1 Tax=unclassified Rhizobium TaxID=2613769 RepID=UPI0006FC4167|nr:MULTISPECIES: PAS domain-containing sensor histidine kinase [unclassified Rhizobium]KQV37679.1 histidine kinase [Rhizobium sp. Root1212]KRD34581.1 histidine kinase [Rhizobium sp. Root268]
MDENDLNSEQRYRLLIEAITDYAIYMLDRGGFVTSWNAGAERLKGYTESEIVGRHFSTFYTDEDRAAELPAKALQIAEQEGRFEREGWRQRKDGSRFWANVIIDPIRNADGELIGFAKITRDISEKRAAQEAIFQSQKMEAVGQLTGGLAHDFNNLLTAILGSLEIAKKRAVRPDVADLIENAIQGAQRGATLTQRLLAFSRRQELQLGSVDVGNLVRGMAELMRRTIGPEVVITTQFPSELPPVRTDANQLESALLNLVVNARDAMPDGGEIVIAAERRSIEAAKAGLLLAGNYLCLSVRDEGEGMDAETLANATTPFFTTKGVGKGTGLGLPMVHGLMAQSGGQLILKSALGEGTTAELWLPVTIDVAATPVSAEEVPFDPAPSAMMVLVVDDDSLVLMNTVLLLEDLGMETIQASSGEEALEILGTGQLPDVVITDHAMPKMTGARLCEEIHARFPTLPVVLATGYAELPEGTAEIGGVVRLTKPFSQKQLSRALAEACQGGRCF